jgi:hypothetical protein
MSNEEIFAAFQQLSEKEKQTILSTLLQNLQLSGSATQFENQYVDGYGYGGRIGYEVPMGDDRGLSFGLTGSGYSVDTPYGTFSDRELTGGDVGYRFGPNKLSASYETKGMAGNELGVVPTEDIIRLLYSRQF